MAGPVDEKAGAKLVYTRDEFKALVLGKTEAEVIAAVGRPDITTNQQWRYQLRVMNPAIGKPDRAVIVFDNGVVAEVRW